MSPPAARQRRTSPLSVRRADSASEPAAAATAAGRTAAVAARVIAVERLSRASCRAHLSRHSNLTLRAGSASMLALCQRVDHRAGLFGGILECDDGATARGYESPRGLLPGCRWRERYRSPPPTRPQVLDARRELSGARAVGCCRRCAAGGTCAGARSPLRRPYARRSRTRSPHVRRARAPRRTARSHTPRRAV